MPNAVFVTKVRTPEGKEAARLLIESVRTFGGAMSGLPFLIFATDPQNEPCRDLAAPQVEVIPLTVPDAIQQYPFGDKVLACANAEAHAPDGVQSLIWLDLNVLMVQPPALLALDGVYDAALRPVHIRNVGMPPSDPLDAFWSGIYAALGVKDVDMTVESFIDHQPLRAYFNSHVFAVNPARGLFARWYDLFDHLVGDQAFQAEACSDALHRIFLFQALFSALAATSLDEQRIRVLPATYSYPYNLHANVLENQRPATLNDLVCFTFEGRPIQPSRVSDALIHEPLRSWLEARAALKTNDGE